MKPDRILILLFFLGSFLVSCNVQATHVRAADIEVERICGSLTYRIKVIAYLNSTSGTRFGTNSVVSFGDGTEVRIPVTESTRRTDLGENISVATFTTMHTFSRHGTYTISYVENDRSRGVLNIANSEDVPYVTFIKIDTDDKYGCNNFPVLAVVPLDRACSGISFLHNSGAFDIDGDSLSYEMSVPSASPGVFATYTAPNNTRFYIDFPLGNEEKTGPPSFSIHALTGLVTWNAPGMQGEYNIAFKIIEWRKMPDGTYAQLSATTRDMQIVVEECENTRPDLIIPEDICVTAGTTVSEIIKGTDFEKYDVKIEVFSEVLQLESNPASYSPVHTGFVSSSPPAEITFSWLTDCSHIRQQPYQVVFKITDNPIRGPKLVTYKTWSVRVVAPPPVFTSAVINVVNNNGMLDWETYSCTNAKEVQVWRKVEGVPFTPANCQIGIPGYLGYQLVGLVPASMTSFNDTNFGRGLNPGATYCYRLVVLISDTKSYVSDEICIGPVKADAPVITHVSVEQTEVSGKIRVSWRSPFDIDKEQFPEPYQYEIYRATGFIGDTSIVKAGIVPDTTFLDSGMDTQNKVFNYRVVVYSKPSYANEFIPVDTSSVASSVRLTAFSETNAISLHWRDSVPWSNFVISKPYHLIYRGEGLDSEDSMILLDSALVTENGFRFTDESVNRNQIYSYKVLTRGTYGNPKIGLLENYSQVVYAYPVNDLVPCPPLTGINEIDCGQYLGNDNCNLTTFSNYIWWEKETLENCRVDITSYRIYASSSRDGSFELLGTVDNSQFSLNDENLSSMAKCYRVSAVDSRNMEGPMSEPVCNDNCPYFELPNVFTPNGDGCNELFTARYEESEGNNCELSARNKCPRFVKSVSVKIYNRWGRKVFQSDSGQSGSIYIDWNGNESNGQECSTGVYYYTADVSFDVLDPGKRIQTFKGWVHLLR